MSRHGPQEARVELFRQRISVREAAAHCGVPERHLRNVVTGRTHPMPKVRRNLPRLLGRPLGELFTEDLLAKQYQPRSDRP